MSNTNKRRSFLKSMLLSGTGMAVAPVLKASEIAVGPAVEPTDEQKNIPAPGRKYNSPYSGEYLNRVAFPIGGLGAGMFCLEGTGAISHMSVRNKPDIFNEPPMFAAITVKGLKNGAKVLEGQVQDWKMFGQR